MLWISTVVERTGDRKYRVLIWDRKDPDDAEYRMDYSLQFINPNHPESEDELRVSLMAWVYYLLNKKNVPDRIRDGRDIVWHTQCPDVVRFISRENQTESLEDLHRYVFTRFVGLKAMPMAHSMAMKARIAGESWWKAELPFLWHREVISTPLGPVQLTQSALVKYAQLSVHQPNTSAIALLRDRLNSEFIKELAIPDIVMEQKRQRFGDEEVRVLFHSHYPHVKLLFCKRPGAAWRLVEVYQFDERVKRKSQSKIKKPKAKQKI